MKWIIMVLVMIISILIVICYSLCVIASQEHEQDERMYDEWLKVKGADDE